MSPLATQRVAYLVGPERIEMREDAVSPPGPGELLLAIEAATTCGTDVKVFRRGGHPRMLKVPTPFGHEMAGVVAAVGAGVTRWRAGDRVVIANSAPCGACAYCQAGRENLCEDLQYLNGAFGERLLVPARFVERSVHSIPDSLPFELAALAEPLACVVHGLDATGLREACDVLIYGGGPIGLLFVGALAAAGHRVQLADPNPPRLEAGLRLGAVRALPISRGGGQAERVIGASGLGRGFDAAIEATGVPEVWADAMLSVRPGGIVNLFGGCAPGTTVPLDTHRIHYSEITVKGVYHHRPDAFRRAIDLLASRAFDAGLLLTHERPLERLEEALRLMMRKEALKVRIRMDS